MQSRNLSRSLVNSEVSPFRGASVEMTSLLLALMSVLERLRSF